jgi:hypothetical protein
MRGFARMSPEKRREIASKGGKAAHVLGVAHKWTAGEEARAASEKGVAARLKRTNANGESYGIIDTK